MIVAQAANIGFHAALPASLPWSVIPLFVYAAGMTFSMPTLTLVGLDFFPAHRGLAASCQAFLLTAGNAFTAGVLVPLVSASPLTFALGATGLLLLSLLCAMALPSRATGEKAYAAAAES
jgi:DHA1 family bicyclomycin/chloramphenicol resistance-like MFS transporter